MDEIIGEIGRLQLELDALGQVLHGATDQEIAFLRTQRVELNAMTSRQFVAYLEAKLSEHGVKVASETLFWGAFEKPKTRRPCRSPRHLASSMTAIDVGANLGMFAYALADIADRVVAFEPNPDYALFARSMLRGRAEVHALALSNACGRGTLYVPLSDEGTVLHLAGSLKRTHSQFRRIMTYEVEVRTLDDFGFMDVRFIKADVEGSEREVLDGARETIARARPKSERFLCFWRSSYLINAPCLPPGPGIL